MRRSHRRSTAPYGIDELAGAVVVFDEVVVSFVVAVSPETRTVPFASIVFISGNSELSLGMHAMREGAVDFLEKPLDEEALVSSIIRGSKLMRKRYAEHAQRIELEGRFRELTPREREVFALITRGLLNKQVGAELGTTERTVKAHREHVMIKMRADSLAGLVRMSGILEFQFTRTQSGQHGMN
jgi:FixJ family two-component response regulator